MENAKVLIDKITNLLAKLNMRYQEIDPYNLSMSGNQISV